MSDSPDLQDEPGLGLDLPDPAPKSPALSPYRVLARKYRPQTFAELIGQDAMVTTLGNAIARGRIAHAFLLTGVRGVGKTSTARLVAKALNCIGPDGKGGPTIEPCGICEPCRAIAEGRYIDVIEMDAASHTGIDDVREIIEAVRYSAVSARYKIYIIDEVHMLSKQAFNGLLKTLEEPPAHVKFLFATTEVAKVPVTVLSRCQRFDLRRISAETLAAHFGMVAKAEKIEIEDEALRVIARAAEGSVRDGLSILDQAIAHATDADDGKVDAAMVRGMLGLADRGRIGRLLELLLLGDAASTLAQLDEANALGIDPSSLLRGLMEAIHRVTRTKAGAARDPLQSTEEGEAADSLAGRLSWGQLHRLWQMLLRGLSDVAVAPDPQEAATMALLRVIHAAELPDPSAVLKKLLASENASARSSTPPAGPAQPTDFTAFVEQVERHGKQLLGVQLRDHVGLIAFGPGAVTLNPLRPLGPDFARELAAAAKAATGAAWEIRLAEEGGAPSLYQQEAIAEEQMRAAVMEEDSVRALLEAFPDATLESIHGKEDGHAQS